MKESPEEAQNTAKDNDKAEIQEETMEQEASSELEQEVVNTTEADDAGLKKLQDELADMKDKYLRLYSEFDNFRRRTAREKLDLIQNANEKLVTALLPVMDDFERAEKSFQNLSAQDQEGIQLIQNKFKKILEQYGVKAMEIEHAAAFDPDFHEAITQLPTEDEKLKGKVVDVVEKGYMLHEKVVRFAKVVIGA
ncbi:MAG TPA: nucleotide exchange factor GrpE [Cyclobacteriaceae bacterium]|nr:nucleotide exchange factor GrpE [Cyclobacteriaceae bacterium]